MQPDRTAPLTVTFYHRTSRNREEEFVLDAASHHPRTRAQVRKVWTAGREYPPLDTRTLDRLKADRIET
jgi:hypothetical protein